MGSYHRFVAVVWVGLNVGMIYAQPGSNGANAPISAEPARASALSNGIEVRQGDLHERVVALRDDLLRVTIWRGEVAPEDASWAVLASARASSVPVTQQQSQDHFGFSTRELRVEIDRGTLEFVIRAANGLILQKDSRPVRFDGDAFRIYKTMPSDEHYFGLGDKTGPLDRRGRAFTLWNSDAYRFQEATDPLYKSIPFFMAYRAGRAMGVLLDNTGRSSFDFGNELPDAYSFGAIGGPVSYYVFGGGTPKEVVKTYAWLTGTPPLPPLWTLGFQQSRYSYLTQGRVLEVADRLRADNIPADAVYLDIAYQDKNRPFTVDRAAFPDLKGMVEQLHRKNFHVVAITDLHIADCSGQSYIPFDSGIAGDHFVKNRDGSVYIGRVWPGPSVFPDFTRQQTRAWWGTLYAGLKQSGVDGFWNDMNEPAVFDSASHTIPEDIVHRVEEPGFAPRTASHAEIHNVYGMENSRATYEGLKALDPSLRPFVLTRATYAGGQRYAATWTGDNSSNWAHLRMTTPMLESLGLSGFSFSGADVGGYAGTPSPELLTKWFEVAAFHPIFRDHTEEGTADQEPWAGGVEAEAIRRRFIEARYRLMPYLYSLAEEASRTGLPMMRPMFLEYPEAAPDRHPIDIDLAATGEFMLGPDLLIAPPPNQDERGAYEIEFPSLGWYDYWSGKKVPEPADKPQQATSTDSLQPPMSIKAVPESSTVPVFVRAGSILPLSPLVQSTDITPSGPLILRVYAGEKCEGTLYLDDGKSYDYLKGTYLRMNFSCQVLSDGLRLDIGAHTGSYPAWWKELRIETYGLKPKQGKVYVNFKELNSKIEREANAMVFDVPDDGHGMEIEVRQ